MLAPRGAHKGYLFQNKLLAMGFSSERPPFPTPQHPCKKLLTRCRTGYKVVNAIHKGKLRSWIVRTHLLFPASYLLSWDSSLDMLVCVKPAGYGTRSAKLPGRQSDSMTRHKNFSQRANVRQDF
jgi:hypothetical protein